jgi:hypothetical protein
MVPLPGLAALLAALGFGLLAALALGFGLLAALLALAALLGIGLVALVKGMLDAAFLVLVPGLADDRNLWRVVVVVVVGGVGDVLVLVALTLALRRDAADFAADDAEDTDGGNGEDGECLSVSRADVDVTLFQAFKRSATPIPTGVVTGRFF